MKVQMVNVLRFGNTIIHPSMRLYRCITNQMYIYILVTSLVYT